MTCVPGGPDAGRSVSRGRASGLADVAPVPTVAAGAETLDRGTGAEDGALGEDAELAQPAASISDAATPRSVTSRFHMNPPATRVLLGYMSLDAARRSYVAGEKLS